MLFTLAVLAVLGYITWTLLHGTPTLKNGVYRQPGQFYHVKRIVVYVWIKLRCLREHGKSSSDKGHDPLSSKSNVDAAQPLVNHPQALDDVCFSGFSSHGNSIVCHIGRRDNRQAQLWLLLEIPGIGCLQHPVNPVSMVTNTEGSGFVAGGIRVEVVEPMKTWRLSFSGMLRKSICTDVNNSDAEFVHVKFSLLWRSFNDQFDLNTDIHPGCLASSIARETWTKELWNKITMRTNNHYQQWGEMRGRLEVEGHEGRSLCLKTCRDRLSGVYDWSRLHRYILHSIYLETGMTIQVGVISSPDSLSHLQIGYISYGSGLTVPVSQVTLDLPQLGEVTDPPDFYSFSFNADGKSFHVDVNCGTSSVFYHHGDKRSKVIKKLSTFLVNRRKGYGIAEFFYGKLHEPEVTSLVKSVPLVTNVSNESIKGRELALTLPFTDPACCSPLLVGGKGAQLAQLTSIQEKVDAKVPPGFCVTTFAYQQQVKACPELGTAVHNLANTKRYFSTDELKSSCEEIVSTFQRSEITSQIREAILRKLTSIWGDDIEQIKLAVRSSASGEDGVESSTAGQLDTYLGVVGIEQVLDSVVKCWASGYTFQAVQYRRQQGQEVGVSVGVVIQQMISSDVAGVLFTKDPLTDNPNQMIINANYGVGESVVSGVADADTIRIFRNWNDQLTIQSKVIGQKCTSIKVSESGGIESVNVEGHMTTECCLSDETSLLIGQAGVELEKHYGSARDVEWAIKDRQLYLLQARPVTSEDLESEEDLIHEFDSGQSSDHVWLTTGNIGEMMPGAVTPLTNSIFTEAVDKSLQGFFSDWGCISLSHSALKSVFSYCNHLFISLHHLGCSYLNITIGNKPMSDISVLGEVLTELSITSVAEYHRTQGILYRLWNSVKMIQSQRRASNLCKEIEKRLKTLTPSQSKDSLSIYDDINQQLQDYYEVWKETIIISSKSGSWALVLLSVLNGGKPEVSTEHFADIAHLLSNCTDVISVDVPHLLQGLAAHIGTTDSRELFVAMTTQEATSWLMSPQSGESGTKFMEFLKVHGHRCIKEAEMFEKSWSQEPSKLTKIIQSMLKADIKLKELHKGEVETDVLSGLSTPVSWFGRFVLKTLLPRARAAVGMREWAKSMSIQMSHVVKESYWNLGKVMVKEGRLPDEELLFFLTHYEIGQLLRTRSPRLIGKAKRRRKIFPKQMNLEFPKYSIGHAKPSLPEVVEEESMVTSFTLKGMPVSRGEVTGRACIMRSVEDAGLLQAGDILIVPYTDVGWSPYFPLLGGLVTEIGGLVSHGAVVAREYGLPCVVNVSKATSIFKTGQTVHLNGTLGQIEKLE